MQQEYTIKFSNQSGSSFYHLVKSREFINFITLGVSYLYFESKLCVSFHKYKTSFSARDMDGLLEPCLHVYQTSGIVHVYKLSGK